ncbi:MAG: DUF333 domain-containing protein [Syntrophales bacterium]
MRRGVNGEGVYCKFADGSECEEWALMRGECRAGWFFPDSSTGAEEP